MDIIKIIGVGLISLVVILILRQYKPEFAVYISLITGIILLFFIIDKLSRCYSNFDRLIQ